MYHAHDYGQRATDYLINMDAARNISKSSGAEMLVVLQPSLAEREHKTRIEKRLLKRSLISHPSVREINESYASIRSGLYKRSQNDGFHYLDCSKIFDSELETTFTDIWHFTDFGHEILGHAMAEKLFAILNHRK